VAAVDGLSIDDPSQVCARRPDEEAPRLEQDGRLAKDWIPPPLRGQLLESLAHSVQVERSLVGPVRDPQPSADVDEPQRCPDREGNLAGPGHRGADVIGKGVGVEDVRGPEGVHPEQVEIGRSGRPLGTDFEIGRAHPELAGAVVADEPDALQASGRRDRCPEHHRDDPVGVLGNALETFELAEGLDRDRPNSDAAREPELLVSFARAREDDPFGRDPRPHRRCEFTARGDVGTEPKRTHVVDDCQGRVRLDRVGDLEGRRQDRPQRFDLAGGDLEVVDVDGGSKSGRELSRVEATESTGSKDLVAGRWPASPRSIGIFERVVGPGSRAS
jgi:hypothetical protein